MHARRLNLVCLVLLFVPSFARAQSPKNVLFYIGDGMGPEQVRAANFYNGGPLSFEMLPYQGEVTTHSANSSITDSAAAATALATGVKVNNGVISLELPGSGGEIVTLMEEAQSLGKSVGLLTTAYLTHATPAAFGAHETSRNNYSQIAGDYLNQTLPNILYGGGGNGLSVSSSQAAGYEVATTLAEFNALPLSASLQSGQFGSAYMPYKYDSLGSDYLFPTLPEMVAKAIDVLSQNPNGFFLMIEGGRIDHACHDNKLEHAVHETLDFSDAVQVGADWATARDDTLVLVTADHETGGLTVTADNGAGQYPSVTWSSGGHTGVNVPVYAMGANSELVGGVMDNTAMVLVCTLDNTPTYEPTNPYPNDGSIEVPLDVLLSWAPGVGATSHNVYWGESDPPTVLLGNTVVAWIIPPTLSANTVYFWQVEEVTDQGSYAGAVWNFTTTFAPDPVGNPTPSDGTLNVPVDVALSWQVGARTDSVEVYFGTEALNLQLVSQQTDNTFQPGVLEEGTQYYWSIDAINTAGITVGDTWAFTTAIAPPPEKVTASSESTSKGNLPSGNYNNTFVSDDIYEELEEVLSAPNKNAHSKLDHTWAFNVGSSPSAVLYVEAYQSHSYDGDNFVLSYSQDNVNFTEMLTITKESDTGVPQVYVFPEALNGTVYVRVQDTDRTRKNQQLDTFFVDHMYIYASRGGTLQQYAATAPSPSDGSEDIGTSVTLSWTAGDDAVSHNVWLAWDNDRLESGNEDPTALVSAAQSGTSYDALGLLGETTYYWRIDEIRDGGVTEGQLWSFTTNPDGNCDPSSFEAVGLVLGTVDGARGKKFGTATVTVENNCNEIAEGVLVTGHFTGSFTETVAGATDSNGIVVLQTTTAVKKPTFGFVVDALE